MKIKKLVSLCLGVVLCMAMLCMGIYAIQNFKLEVTGVIDFIAYEKLVYIEKVELKNFVTTDDNGVTYVTQNKELSAYSGKYISNSENVTPIDISNIKVMNGEELTIAITMKSLSEDEIVVSGTNNTTSGITITYSNTTLPANPSGNVASGQSGVFIITISNANTGSVNLSDVKINISYSPVEPVVAKTLTLEFSPVCLPENNQISYSNYLIRVDNGSWVGLNEFRTNDTIQFYNSISIKSIKAKDADEHIVSDFRTENFGRNGLVECLTFYITSIRAFSVNNMGSEYITEHYKNFITFTFDESITISAIYSETQGGGGSD